MAQNVLQVFGGRELRAYYLAWATANAMPADTVVWGTTPTGWTDLGFTSGGMSLTANQPRTEIRVDQLLDAVRRVQNSRDLRMAADLSEMVALNYKFALGDGAITTVAPGAGTRGHDQLDLTGTPVETYYSILFDIEGPDGEALRLLGWRTLNVGSVNNQFRDTAAATLHIEQAVLPDSTTNPTRVFTVRRVSPAI